MPIVDYNGSGNLRFQSYQQNRDVVRLEHAPEHGVNFWVQSDEDGFGIADESLSSSTYDESDYLKALGLGLTAAINPE